MILIEKVKKIIEKYGMLDSEDKIVVGVSGGPDSITLLHILWRLKEELNISIISAHLNHGLRGKDAVTDEEFVKEFSYKLGIPVRTESVKVHDFAKSNNLTIEEAGRKLRYELYRKIAEETSSNKVAVGHNLDDQAETVLMRIIRGSGIDGIAGMPPVRNLTEKIKVIRPLIEISREEILKHLKNSKLEVRVDRTNFARTYFRNRVRLELLPILEKKYNRNIKKNLVNLANIFSSENDFFSNNLTEILSAIIKEKTADEIVMNKNKLIDLHLSIKRRCLRECIKMLGGLSNITFEHIEDVIDGLNKNNLEFELPNSIRIIFRYDSIIITKSKEKNPENYEYKLKIPGNTEIKEASIIINAEYLEKIDLGTLRREHSKAYLDADLLEFPLIGRNRKEGDKFTPFGLAGTKKIKKFFIDNKVPHENRNKMPIVTDSRGNIAWIAGHRIDNRFRITPLTKNILKLEIK